MSIYGQHAEDLDEIIVAFRVQEGDMAFDAASDFAAHPPTDAETERAIQKFTEAGYRKPHWVNVVLRDAYRAAEGTC